jgi:hypothetical protein
MSTAQEIEDAIRSLPASELAKLLEHLPQIFPEFAGDKEWDRIIDDQRPRPALSELLDRYKSELATQPAKFPKVVKGDFTPKD